MRFPDFYLFGKNLLFKFASFGWLQETLLQEFQHFEAEYLQVSSTIDHLLRAVDACSTTEEIRDHAVEREPGKPKGDLFLTEVGE